MKKEFDSKPVYGDEYIKTKTKFYFKVKKYQKKIHNTSVCL